MDITTTTTTAVQEAPISVEVEMKVKEEEVTDDEDVTEQLEDPAFYSTIDHEGAEADLTPVELLTAFKKKPPMIFVAPNKVMKRLVTIIITKYMFLLRDACCLSL